MILKKFFSCLLFLFFTTCPLIYADTLQGKKLLEYCQVAMDIYDNNYGRVQTENEFLQGSKAGICEGYLMSMNDLRQSNSSSDTCNINECNKLKIIALVVKYLKNHPKELQRPASTLVLNAYQTYFPCR